MNNLDKKQEGEAEVNKLQTYTGNQSNQPISQHITSGAKLLIHCFKQSINTLQTYNMQSTISLSDK